MRKLFLSTSFLLLSLYSLPSIAQTASNICLEELKTAWQSVDQAKLLQGDQVTSLEYDITYTMTSDPEKKVISGHEKWLIAKNRIHHYSDEGQVFTDENHAFFYRPHQYLIYLAPSALKDEKVFQSIDAGFWSYCTVTHCDYIKTGAYEWNGQTVTPKEYAIEISPEGQKKYQITSLEVITDPVFKRLISMDLTYSGKMLYSSAKYSLTSFSVKASQEAGLTSLDEQFLAEPGKLKPPYDGCTLQDVR